MDRFQALYQEKLQTPEEAVKIVKSGDWLDFTFGPSMPAALDKALAERAEELDDVNIRTMLSIRPLAVMDANDRNGRRVFTLNSWHFSGFERQWEKKGYVFFSPFRFFEAPEMYRRPEDVDRVDVLMVQTTPMDRHGFFNLGPSNAYIPAAARRAKHVIVEVNRHMPYVEGLYDERLSIADVDAVVEHDSELSTIGNAEPSETDRKIASVIMDEIPNGATLQLGIGGMPNAVGELIAASDLRNLGIHTEMYVDSMMAMTEAGVITGRNKNRDRGKQVFTFAMGSAEMYAFMDHNPQIASAPVDYVNNPAVIATIDHFISINNAIEIDLYGQINAETAGARHISGTGGQLDFVEGAYHSRGGKSFVALSSTFTNSKGVLTSRIIPFTSRSVVTDPRTTVQHVVTEFGMFNLKGKTTWQRAEGIIGLAHPDFREELIRAAEEQRIWRRSNKR